MAGQDGGNVCVNLLSVALEQGAIDRVPKQDVFERKPNERRNPDSINDISLLEPRESEAQIIFVNAQCKAQKIVGKFAPDHGGDLCQPSTLSNAIEPLDQCIVKGLRDRKRDGLACSLGFSLF
jgi:hypothetical protein